MKIKPKKVKMNVLERGRFYDRLCCCIAFVNSVAIDQIEVSIRKMRNVVKDEELLWNLKVCRAVDDVDHIIKGMMELLGKRTRLCRVCTAPHLICYERNYINDQRVTQGVQHLSRKRLGFQMEDLRQKAKTVCLNSATKQAAGLMQEALVATSWVRIIERLSNYWLNKWKQVAGKAATITIASLFLNQARGIANNCTKLSDALDGLRYEAERTWWTQYHKAEDEMLDGLIGLLDNAKFNDMVSDYMTKDWTDFYIGSAALETQQTGEVPEAVIKEIEAVGKMIGKSIRLPFVTMIKALAKKVEKTDDIYDFVDYLNEHPWKMRDTLHEVAMQVAYPDKNKN